MIDAVYLQQQINSCVREVQILKWCADLAFTQQSDEHDVASDNYGTTSSGAENCVRLLVVQSATADHQEVQICESPHALLTGRTV